MQKIQKCRPDRTHPDASPGRLSLPLGPPFLCPAPVPPAREPMGAGTWAGRGLGSRSVDRPPRRLICRIRQESARGSQGVGATRPLRPVHQRPAQPGRLQGIRPRASVAFAMRPRGPPARSSEGPVAGPLGSRAPGGAYPYPPAHRGEVGIIALSAWIPT